MNRYQQWARAYPEAAKALEAVLVMPPAEPVADGLAETQVQQQVRFKAAQAGALSWRNNVGATPAKTVHTCPFCAKRFQQKQRPVRYGLANDSEQLNKQFKSADLILAIPRVITPQDVGRTIAQFGSIEVKRPGQHRVEPGQLAWAALISKAGGYACITTGEVIL